MHKLGYRVLISIKKIDPEIEKGSLMFYRQKITGLITLSIGVGMLLALLLPIWVFILAASLIMFGFYNLFFC